MLNRRFALVALPAGQASVGYDGRPAPKLPKPLTYRLVFVRKAG